MKTISFKVSEEEARQIRFRAKQEHLSVSEYIRRRACSEGRVPQKPKKVLCPRTGALVFSPLKNQPPLTTKLVQEILSDFP
jgi:hypothetical protein